MLIVKDKRIKKNDIRLMCIVSILLLGVLNVQGQNIPSRDSVIKIMKKVADAQFRQWDVQGMRHARWDWTNGAAYSGFMALNEIAGTSKYQKKMYEIGESLHWNTGPHRLMADDYCVAQMYSQLYSIYKEPKMIAPFKALADTIVSLPHKESLEWKNSIQLREWAWCDALFMAPPALAYLSTVTGDEKYLNTAVKLWWKTTDYLFDSSENLYFRDSKYFNRKEANGKKMFWSRGNGWVMGGLVRLLTNMPENYPGRNKFVTLFQNMSAKIAFLQHEDGTWHTALLDSLSYPVKETSGTGFYCYALTWGINNGMLSKKEYLPVVSKAWKALENAVHPDGVLGYVQQIGEKPELVDQSSTEAYGVGAFLLAGSEIIKL
jgi:unsaturated rhamnogalacturonyl hydrolase